MRPIAFGHVNSSRIPQISYQRIDQLDLLKQPETTCTRATLAQSVTLPEDAFKQWQTLAKESEFKAGKLAHKCGVSLRTLQRHFHSHYKMPLRDTLRHIRLTEAYSRLCGGERVKFVAYDLSYKQLSHFSRDFSIYFGVAPSLLNGKLDVLKRPNRESISSGI